MRQVVVLIRRLVVLVASVAFLGAVWTAPVTAADYQREVTFPSAGFGENRGDPVLVWDYIGVASCDGPHAYQPFEFYNMVGSSEAVPPSSDSSTGPNPRQVCRTYANEIAWEPAAGVSLGQNYQVSVEWGGDYGSTLKLWWLVGTPAGQAYNFAEIAVWTSLTTAQPNDGSYNGAAGVLNLELAVSAAPVNAIGLGFQWGGSNSWAGPHHIDVAPVDGATGGTCVGTGYLAWGAGFVTGSSGWGDQWNENGGFPGCVAGQPHTVDYVPSDWVAGHKMEFTESYAGFPSGTPGRETVSWLFSSAGPEVMFDYTTHNYAGGYWKDWGLEAPVGSIGVRWTIFPGTIQYLHDVKDRDVAGYSTAKGLEGSADNPLSACKTPTDVLDIGGWFGWLGCVISGVVSNTVAGVGNLLRSLFVPTSLGYEWSYFVTRLDGKVPFGWVAEAVGVLQSFYSPAIAGPAPPLSMQIMGATVPIDLTVTAPIEVYRPALVTVVWVGLAFAILRLGRGVFGSSGGGPEA